MELNRSKYETLRLEQSRFTNLANSNRDELNQILTVLQERLPPVATVPRVPPVPAVATQPFQAISSAVPTMATQPQAALPSMPAMAPQVSQATEPPASMASASVPVQPSAFQAVPPQPPAHRLPVWDILQLLQRSLPPFRTQTEPSHVEWIKLVIMS